jgi:hypothetical protein
MTFISTGTTQQKLQRVTNLISEIAMKRQILLLIRETMIYYLLIIAIWEAVEWILCSKNGG